MQAQWSPHFEAAYLHDSNLSRAQQPEDRVVDSAFVARPLEPAAFETWLAARSAGVLS